jgi:lysophospholipase L1-like esterase
VALRPLLKRVAFAAVGVLVAVLVAEIALRALGVGYFFAFRGDAETGLQHIATAEGWDRDEGDAYVRINSAGFRDIERSIAKPPGTLRVAVIGDSFTEGLQVAQEETFTAVAERTLERCGATAARRVEVLNFGVSSYGTAQELILLRDRVLAYRPDVVVEAVFAGNDISDNSLELSMTPERPYFVERDGQLILNTGFRRFAGNQGSPLLDAYFWLLPRSRVVQAFHNARSALTETRIRADNLAAVAAIPGGRLEQYGLERDLFQEPRSPPWVSAWAITERLLRETRDAAASVGARFLVMTVPSDIQAHPDRAERERVAAALGVRDLGYADERIRRAGERDGYDVIVLAPRFVAQSESSGTYLFGFGSRIGHGHWNAAGHRLAGEMLASELCSRLGS